MTIEPGMMIDGRYRIERLIGEGGMGAVYEVREASGTARALKVVLDRSDAVMLKRFVREAEAARALSSEHATRVFASGLLEDGTPFIVMELLEGRDLAAYLSEHGPLEVQDAVDILLQVCDALGEAHDLGMVHRDVKPANIFVRQRADGRLRAKLLDFGVSKVALTELSPVSQLTQTGTILGSPYYMSPEQLVSSSDVDARADIWSLGATLQEILSGTGPFVGDTVAEVLSSVLRDPPRPLRANHPHIPKEIERVVLRCLDKVPSNRYENVGALADALQHFATPVREAAPNVEANPTPEGIPKVDTQQLRTSRWWLWAAAAAAVLMVATGGWWWSTRRADNEGAVVLSGVIGDDLKLPEKLRLQVSAELRSSLGKLNRENYQAALRDAADAEAMLIEHGLSLGNVSSLMGQDAAFIQARAEAALVKQRVREAKGEDAPLALMGHVKRRLTRVSEHTGRAATWAPEARSRCIQSVSLFTRIEVLDLWGRYIKRLPRADKKVATNYERTLALGVRAELDKLSHPAARIDKRCREGVERARQRVDP